MTTQQTASALDPALIELARGQHGTLTTAQLRAAGISSRLGAHLVSAGVLQHPGRGLYVVESMAETDPVARHRQLVAGALLLYPDAMLTSTSTVLAHDLPVWGAALDRPTILRPVNRTGGVGCFWVRPRRWALPVAESPWGPSVTVADAVAQLAVDAGIAPGLASADAALRAGLLSPDELARAVEAMDSWPRRSRAVSMLALADGRRESVGESRCALALAVAGIRVVPQVEIRDEGGFLVARVDFVVAGTRVIIEFDGKLKYASGDPAVLWEEKRREDRLRRMGYVVVRITWADLERPGGVAARVRAALAAA